MQLRFEPKQGSGGETDFSAAQLLARVKLPAFLGGLCTPWIHFGEFKLDGELFLVRRGHECMSIMYCVDPSDEVCDAAYVCDDVTYDVCLMM